MRDFTTPEKRREFLQKELDIEMSTFSNESIENNSSVHCENLIGAIQIPLGVAGPVLHQGKKVYIPLATTEGALVASVSRGCKALTHSGGVSTSVILHGQTRGPVFKTSGINGGTALKKWIESNSRAISEAANLTSSHISYLGAKVKIIGDLVFVRLSFDTKDAMGMNMVTLATEEIVKVIEKKTQAKCLAVAGNYDIDKKPAFINSIDGRGFEVLAECEISERVLKEVLHSDAKKIFDIWLAKCMIGSYASGSLGYNSHFANIVAAIYIATGQDAAHVVEGSNGITICELRGKNLYISVNMPSVLVGTVGGGTALPTQRKALEMMGIKNSTKSKVFAQMVACGVLAGELSLLASLSTKTLGQAHKKLGRGVKA